MEVNAKQRLKGMALMVGGTLLISPDALCVALVSQKESAGNAKPF
jgi:hypothetical protein